MTTLSVFEPSKMETPSSEIPPAVGTEEVNAQAAAFAIAFPDLTKRFNETYTACIEGINHFSSRYMVPSPSFVHCTKAE
jgi:hypothetical protein